MEAGDHLSALGGACAFRVWRAAVCFLPSGVVASGFFAQRDLSMAAGSERIYMDRSGGSRLFDVCTRAPLA